MKATRNRMLSALTATAVALLLSFPAWAQIGQVADSPEAGSAGEIQGSLSGTTRVIVTKFEIEGGGIVAGATSDIVYTIKNTSATNPVHSVLVAWWSDSVAPLDFVETNQAYVPLIEPLEEVQVTFTVRARPVDLSSSDSIASSLAIHYSAYGQSDRTNNVMVRLPVYQDPSDTTELEVEESWQWPAPRSSGFLNSRLVKITSLGGFGLCCMAIALVLWRRRVWRV